MALLQLATREAVFLLDIIALTEKITKDTLRDFIAAVFSSTDTIKLGHCLLHNMYVVNTLWYLVTTIGYGITGDFRVMAHSWPFVAEIVGTPCNVIDLQSFAYSVRILSDVLC